MKTLLLIFAVSFSILMATQAVHSQVYRDLTTQQSYDLWIAEKSNPNFVIIDIRTASEYAGGHLAEAINIDFYKTDEFYDFISKLDKSKKYLLYCASSNRSGQAVAEFKKRNYDFVDMNEMDGGINSWKAKGYPVTTEPPTSVDDSKLFQSNLNITFNSGASLLTLTGNFHSQIKIYNAIGNLMIEKEMNTGSLNISTENLPKGLYILKSKDAVKLHVRKIVID